MPIVVEELVVEMVGKAAQYESMLNRVASRTGQTMKQVQKDLAMGRQFQQLTKRVEADAARPLQEAGQALGQGLRVASVAAAAGAGLAAKSFADFDYQLATIRANAAQLSAGELEQVRAKIEELAAATGTGPTEVAAAFGELLKAGVPVEKVLGGVGEQALKFARVSGVGMADTAVVLADAMNKFEGEGLTAERAANLMNQAADATTLNLQEVVEAFKAGAGPMQLFGQNAKDTTTAIALLGQNMLKGEAGGTALKTLMLRLTSGTDGAQKGMDALGLKVRDAAGNMLPMVEIIRNLQESVKGRTSEEVTDALTAVGGVRGIQVLQVMLKEGVAGWEKMQAAMEQSLTVNQKFDILMGSFKGTLLKAWAAVQLFANEVGERLAPMLTFAWGVVQQGIQLWRGLPEWIKTATVAVLAVTAALGPLLLTVGLIGPALQLAASGMIAFGASLLLNPVTLILGGIVALALALSHLRNEMINAKGDVDEFNIAMARTDQLQTQLAERMRGRGAGIIAEAAQIQGPGERRKFLEAQLETMKKELAGAEARAKEIGKRVGEWKGDEEQWGILASIPVALFGRGAEAEAELKELAGHQETLKITRDTIASIQKELGKTAVQETKAVQAGGFWKALVSGLAPAAAKLAQDVGGLNAKLEEQALLFGLSGDAAEIRKLQMQGASEADLANARGLANMNHWLEENKRLLDEGKRVTEQVMTPQEKLAAEQANLQKLLEAGAISEETFARAMQQAQDKLGGVAEKAKEARTELQRLDGALVGTAEGQARLAAYAAGVPLAALGAGTPTPLGNEAPRRAVAQAGPADRMAAEGGRVEALLAKVVENTGKALEKNGGLDIEPADFA